LVAVDERTERLDLAREAAIDETLLLEVTLAARCCGNIAAALDKMGPERPLSSALKVMTPETPETDALRRGPSGFTSATIRENRKCRTLY
jgi:hypothetical protein